jgi:hypothetical protein
MNPGIDLLRAFQNGVSGQVLFGLIHDVQQDAPLASQPHPPARKGGAQFSRFRVHVQPLSGGDPAVLIFAGTRSGGT